MEANHLIVHGDVRSAPVAIPRLPDGAHAHQDVVLPAGVAVLVAALGGLDAFVFTAGIGENSAPMRARIAERLTWLGAKLDPAANAAGKILVSRKDSGLPIYVIPTNEELMIARHTRSLIAEHACAA